MDVSAVASNDVKQAAQTFVLKKTMEVAAQSTLSLINDAVSAAPVSNNPPNLGNSVDVRV